MVRLQRYLDEIETRLRVNNGPSFALEYEGLVNVRHLERAFRILCDRHPVLRGRIRYHNQRYLLYVPESHRPEFVVCSGDWNRLLRASNEPWNPEHSLSQLMLVRNESHGYIALRADHVIVDASSLGAMFGELMTIYSTIVEDRYVQTTPENSLPASPLRLLAARSGMDTAERPSSPTDSTGISDSRKATWRRIRLSVNETSRIVESARRENLSVHSLIASSILIAQRSKATRLSEPTMMRCLSTVDYRRRVSPPVRPTETTNFIGVHTADVRVDSNANIFAVAHALKERFDAAMGTGRISTVDPSLSYVKCPESRIASASISNTGVVPKFSQPAGLVVTDFLIPPRRSARLGIPVYGVYTYNGKLSITSIYPSDLMGDVEIGDVLKTIVDKLSRV